MAKSNFYSKESIKERLQTQDNRITQDPLFVVQEEKIIVGIDTNFNYDGMCFQRMEDEWETIFDTDDEYEDFDKNFWTVDPDWAHDGEKGEPTGYTKEWVAVSYFFTEGAADAYIENQRHNHHGKLRTYAESLYRNPEMKAVRALLLEGEDQRVFVEALRDAPEPAARLKEAAQKFGTEVKFEVAHTISSLDDPDAPGMNWELSDEAKAAIEEIESEQRRAWQQAPFIWVD